jgi:hypothetical protein
MISTSLPRAIRVLLATLLASLLGSTARAGDPWVVYPGGEGPGKGKHIVLVSGDDEYRSEEALPQLGKILAERHGFKCTVLFAVAKDGTIKPDYQENIPGLDALKTADLMVIFTRFRNLPADQMEANLPLPGDSKPLVLGQVLEGMEPDSKPLEGKKNDPMMPVAWAKTYTSKADKTGRVFTTTMGASQDLLSEGVRRMLVNSCYWAIGLEDKIPEKADVALVGDYKPHPFGFGTHVKGLRPEDFAGK